MRIFSAIDNNGTQLDVDSFDMGTSHGHAYVRTYDHDSNELAVAYLSREVMQELALAMLEASGDRYSVKDNETGEWIA